MNNTDKAMIRLLSQSDWIEFKGFNHKKMLDELKPFKDHWKRYNPRKVENNRWGLSVTSFDGGLSGRPDLDSLLNYEQETGITLHNHQCNVPTLVWEECEELKRFLEPWKKWVTRCHFLRMDKGAYFPDHFDVNKHDFSYDEIRFVGFVKADKYNFKWIYDDKLFAGESGSFWYFNASKRHSVFSTENGMMLLVVCMNFDEELYIKMLDTAVIT